MPEWNPIGGALDPRTVLEVNDRPLQHPGTDRRVKTAVAGGPNHAGDRRLYLSAELLRQMLAIAEASPTRRAEVTRAGVRIDLYEQRDGHRYEVWTFIGGDVRPEPMPDAISRLVG